MNFFNNTSLNTRINIYITTLLIVILSILGGYIYENQKRKMVLSMDKQMETYLLDFEYLVDKKIAFKKTIGAELSNFIINELNMGKFEDSVFVTPDPAVISAEIKSTFSDEDILFDENTSFFKRKDYMPSEYKNLIVYKNGEMLLGNSRTKEDISNSKIYNEIKFINDEKVHKKRYLWPEDDKGSWNYMYLKYISKFNIYIAITTTEKVLLSDLIKLRNILIVGIFLAVVILTLTLSILIRSVTKFIYKIAEIVKTMSVGKIPEEIKYKRQDEIGQIVNSLNALIRGLRRTTDFSKEIGRGNLEAAFSPLSEEDDLGNSLLEMRESLKQAEDERRKQQIEEKERNWSTIGHAKFADILRTNSGNLEMLSYNIIKELVRYLEVNQGGLFILNNDNSEDVHLDLMGCFAYDRRKYVTRKVKIGEGLIGTCYIEKATIYITDVPEGYADIVSGLGDADPRCILIVPMKLNEEVFGIIELLSIETIDNYKIQFVEKLGEIIASTISTVKINLRTAHLLEQSQLQSEEMKAKEEELRQNMEELQATQEEAARREIEISNTLLSIDEAVPTIELDMQGNIIDVNSQYISLTGMTISELQHKKLIDFIPKGKSNVEYHQKMWKDISRGNFRSGDHHYIFNNKDKWFYETFTPVKNEKEQLVKVVGLITEISRFKNKELELENKTNEIQLLNDKYLQEIMTLKSKIEEMSKNTDKNS